MLKPLVEAAVVLALAVQPLEGHHLASVLAATRVRDQV
jgi:hypothetical protein